MAQIASRRPKNGVAFDYAVARQSLDFFNRMAAAGEPFVSFFDPEKLAHALRQMGFTHMRT